MTAWRRVLLSEDLVQIALRKNTKEYKLDNLAFNLRDSQRTSIGPQRADLENADDLAALAAVVAERVLAGQERQHGVPLVVVHRRRRLHNLRKSQFKTSLHFSTELHTNNLTPVKFLIEFEPREF